jgi:hypothetical protein
MMLDDGHYLITLTFSGSIFNSFEDITKPKYMSYVFIKEIFFRFISNFSCCNLLIIDVKWFNCSPYVLMKISMSSRCTMINFPMNYFNTSFINLINVLGAFVNTNGMTNQSNKPSFVLNYVFHSSPSLILIL